MCGNILQYIAHTILLKCENMFVMLKLHALILHSGDNIKGYSFYMAAVVVIGGRDCSAL